MAHDPTGRAAVAAARNIRSGPGQRLRPEMKVTTPRGVLTLLEKAASADGVEMPSVPSWVCVAANGDEVVVSVARLERYL